MGPDKIVGEYIIRTVHLKKRVACFDQVRVELKRGSANANGYFIDVFGAELWFFGNADHQDSFFRMGKENPVYHRMEDKDNLSFCGRLFCCIIAFDG